MNGIQCDECLTGYRPGKLIMCAKCEGEFCDSCKSFHVCGGHAGGDEL